MTGLVLAILAVIVVAGIGGWAVARRRSARPGPDARITQLAYDHGDPYPANTYGTNPRGISLGPIAAAGEQPPPAPGDSGSSGRS